MLLYFYPALTVTSCLNKLPNVTFTEIYFNYKFFHAIGFLR